MTPQTIYTKTAKGVQEVKNRSIRLPRESALVFLAVDGKCTVAELPGKTRLEEAAVLQAIEKLTADGYIKVFQEQAASKPAGDESLDLDFTSPAALAKLNVEVTARGQAEAAAKARALTAAREAAEARARQEAEAKARAAAEQKAQAEAQARLKAEAAARSATEARAKAEAEANAATEAKARAEAEARANIALEAKTKADAEAKARAEAEQKAQAEAQARLKAEAQARGEAEARARVQAEAKARADAEAKARTALEAKMRAMEEALQLAEQRAQAEAAARMRAEAEAQEHAAAEARARSEAEARAKAAEEEAAQARALAESAAAARAAAEAAARARAGDDRSEEIEAIAKAAEIAKREAEQAALALANAEAKIKTEAEARVLAEARTREEMEAREAEKLQREAELQVAREEAEAQIRAKLTALEDNVRNARDEAEARAEAERKGREEAEQALSAVRIAHEQAVAKAQAETMARVQAEQKALTEKRARAAAEDRAKQEAVARVMQEHQLKQRADKEVKAKVEAEIKARQRAEIEAETQARAEAQKRAEETAARRLREQQEAATQLSTAATTTRKPVKWGRMAGIALIVLVIAAIGALQIAPLSGYLPGVQQLLSERLQQPVTIADMRFSLLPSPQLRLEHIAIGPGQEIKISNAVVPVDSLAILQGNKDLSEVRLFDVAIDQRAIAWLIDWSHPQNDSPLHIGQIDIISIKLGLHDVEWPPFDANLKFGRDNALRSAALHDTMLNVELQPDGETVHASFNAHGWAPPIGPTFVFADVSGNITADRQHAVVSDLDGRLYGGSLKGGFTVTWGSGLNAEGQFNVHGLDLSQLLPFFTHDFVASGALDADAKFTTQGQAPADLFNAPRIDGTFTLHKGALNNLDIVRAIQNPVRNGTRGGRTQFDELNGEIQAGGNRISYRNLKISSGPMSGTGSVDISPASELSGRLTIEVSAGATVIAHGVLNLSGGVKDPVLSP